ncbi:MAG: DPP IV N-terminal domain-containing protein [Planctomycetes bacterium]|nr:DPP IV N-terminal domain-containing protein [Planctomycetota bacterium]
MRRLPSLLCLALIVTGALAGLATAQERKLSFADTFGQRYRTSSPSFSWDAEGRGIMIDGKRIDPATGEVIEGEASPGPRGPAVIGPKMAEGEIGARTSPDQKLVAFVRDHDLYVRGIGGEGERAVATDGSSELLYGRLDWVYQEEVYGRGDFNGMWWSPDSSRLAYLRIDESPVKEFTVIDHRPNTLEIENTNYPKAGDGNPVATLGVYDLAGGTTTWLDFSAFETDEPLIVHVGWNPKGDRVIFQVQNRIQNRLHLLSGDPASGKVTRILSESSASGWVNRLEQPIWLEDGGFLWWTERTGYKHLDRYDAEGKRVCAVTSGEFVTKDIIRIDEKGNRLWFYGNGVSGAGNYAYRTTLDGGAIVLLTPERGSHRIQLDHDGGYLIDSWSSVEDPGHCVLRDAEGKIVRALGLAKADFDRPYSQPEYHLIPARDGYEMDAIVTKPWDYDPAKTYPVMLFTYSGPDAPSVRDSYRPSTYHQFLAQEGLIILQVNNRSSSGRGQVYIDACYKNFGASELRDLEDAMAWVCKNVSGDPARVGISGWSYGGFMSAYALCKSKAFALGVCGAGVYDWALYDTIYTERYMSTPKLNAEGYRGTSVLEAAKDLHGHLVLLHGTMDDNVHFQNTVRFCDALQQAGKHFELMIYAGMRHGPRTSYQHRHIREIEWNAIQKVLLQR